MEAPPTPPGPRSAVVFRLWQALHRGCRLPRSNARSGRTRTGTTWSTCVASSVRPAAAHVRQSGSSRRTWARSAFHRADETTASSTPQSGSPRRARLYSASAARRRWRIPASERGFDGMTPRHAPAGLSARKSYHAWALPPTRTSAELEHVLELPLRETSHVLKRLSGIESRSGPLEVSPSRLEYWTAALLRFPGADLPLPLVQ
jgi:hypothetical protein